MKLYNISIHDLWLKENIGDKTMSYGYMIKYFSDLYGFSYNKEYTGYEITDEELASLFFLEHSDLIRNIINE